MRPTDIFAWLSLRLQGAHSNVHYPNLSYVQTHFKLEPSKEYGNMDPLMMTRQILDTYHSLTNFEKTPAAIDRARHAVLMMAYRFHPTDLSRMPFGVALPLKEAARLCQDQPQMDWPPIVYTVIGRLDLAKMAGGDTTGMGFGDAYRHKKEFVSFFAHILHPIF